MVEDTMNIETELTNQLVDGRRDGKWVHELSDGSKVIAYYRAGLREGLCEVFYTNGNKQREILYKKSLVLDSVHFNSNTGILNRNK